MEIYSHSRLSSFEQCKLKFKYKYLDKIEPEIVSTIEAFLGSRVHDTLEKLYNDLKFQKLNSKEELFEFLDKEWVEKWTDDIKIVREDYTNENYLDMGKKFVSDYYDRFHPFDQAKLIGCEIHINIKLDSEGKYQLQGYIDRLDSKGEIYEIHDYKTASSLPLQEYIDSDRQLALYALAVKEGYKDAKQVKLIWHYLAFDKEILSERTDEQLEQLKKDTIKLIKEIEICDDFPPATSPLCDWCEFKQICPKWRHLYEAETQEIFTNDDGVKLVDQYAKLKEEELFLNKQLDAIKEKILQFADQKKVSAVFGSDKKATIWSKEVDKLPKTTDMNYDEFVEITKKLGLWDKFSRLDSFKLEKALQNKELHGEILEILKNFAKKEKIARIYMSKRSANN